VIADLSVNHVERHGLLCGYAMERRWHDYGIDLVVYTYDGNGEVESGELLVQLKATDYLKVIARGQAISFRIDRADLLAWLQEPMPVIFVVYDAAADVAYWLYVQAHFEGQPGFDSTKAAAEVTVRIPRTNAVNQTAMRHFAQCRDRILAQTKGAIKHHE